MQQGREMKGAHGSRERSADILLRHLGSAEALTCHVELLHPSIREGHLKWLIEAKLGEHGVSNNSRFVPTAMNSAKIEDMVARIASTLQET